MDSYNNDKYSNKRDVNETDDNEGKLFVGGLAWETDEESLRSYFEKFGPIEAINLKKNKDDTSKHRGFAFIKFKYAQDAEAALCQKEAHVLDGSKIDPKSACPLGIKPEQRTKKIFVGGLQAETTEERLKDYFGQYGEIQNNIEFALDHDKKKRRGFCFIEFGSESIVDRIVKQKYHEVAGKRLETKRALSKQQQQELAVQDNFRKVSAGGAGGAVIGLTGGYQGLGGAAAGLGGAYAQPVIYIHPDSLSTAYPHLNLQGLAGGLAAGYPGLAAAGTQYSAALETIYQPYSAVRDIKGAKVKGAAGVGGKVSYGNPYGKSRDGGRDPYSNY